MQNFPFELGRCMTWSENLPHVCLTNFANYVVCTSESLEKVEEKQCY